MIDVRYKGRLGNNRFQYCLGRILAEGLGFSLRADPIGGFPNTAQPVRGGTYDREDQTLTEHRIDLAAILSNPRPRRIIVDGWLQRHEYYRPHRDRIRQWLTFDSRIRVPRISPESIIVNVRRC